ncbi:MAG: hypothetical protein E7052_03515 [Lentisphaerae bacterium]|nr:hypothetical protein [Lentisphaerota bacterium]
MPIHRNHLPGQRKISRYRHTQSCIRVAGFAPGRERAAQSIRCRIMAVVLAVAASFGIISILS